jgi:hypothetical protein
MAAPGDVAAALLHRDHPALLSQQRNGPADGSRRHMIGYITIPYVIAFANELVDDPIHFEPYRREGVLRLAYKTFRQGDRIDGILRARGRASR